MCSIDPYDFDPTVVLKNDHIVSRKAHTCDSCGGHIPKGVLYWDLRSVSDGHISAEKGCKFCSDVSHEFAEEHGFAFIYPSSVVNFLQECVWEEDERAGYWARVLHDVKCRGGDR